MTIVDSHLHVWDLEGGDYSWLGPQHGPLHRSFTPAEAGSHLAAAGVDSAILVQAEDTVRETRQLLDVASTHAWVHGVVGWVRLDEPREAELQLGAFQGPALRGVRHLVHDDPRDDFFDLEPVRRSLGAVSELGLVLDVPDAWPRHLDSVVRLADVLPELTIILDHLAKPPSDEDGFAAWEKSLRAASERPQIVAKLSGLQDPVRPYTADGLHPVLEVALEAFGVERLMFGSDWPMTLAVGGYAVTMEVMHESLAGLSHDERDAVLSGTTIRTYGRSLHE